MNQTRKRENCTKPKNSQGERKGNIFEICRRIICIPAGEPESSATPSFSSLLRGSFSPLSSFFLFLPSFPRATPGIYAPMQNLRSTPAPACKARFFLTLALALPPSRPPTDPSLPLTPATNTLIYFQSLRRFKTFLTSIGHLFSSLLAVPTGDTFFFTPQPQNPFLAHLLRIFVSRG